MPETMVQNLPPQKKDVIIQTAQKEAISAIKIKAIRKKLFSANTAVIKYNVTLHTVHRNKKISTVFNNVKITCFTQMSHSNHICTEIYLLLVSGKLNVSNPHTVSLSRLLEGVRGGGR